MMFIIFSINILMDVVRSMLEGTEKQWADHLGLGGIKFVLVVMGIYTVMPMLIRTVPGSVIRVAVVVLTIFMGLFVLAHEVSHITSTRDKPFGVLHTLDLLHHVLVVWVVIAGLKWVREGREPA